MSAATNISCKRNVNKWEKVETKNETRKYHFITLCIVCRVSGKLMSLSRIKTKTGKYFLKHRTVLKTEIFGVKNNDSEEIIISWTCTEYKMSSLEKWQSCDRLNERHEIMNSVDFSHACTARMKKTNYPKKDRTCFFLRWQMHVSDVIADA